MSHRYLNSGDELLLVRIHGEDLLDPGLEDVVHLAGVQGRLLVVLVQNICAKMTFTRLFLGSGIRGLGMKAVNNRYST